MFVLLNDAENEGPFTADPYVLEHQLKSVLCLPVLEQGNLAGVLYLENSLSGGAFTPKLVGMLKTLAAQVAISIHNAQSYGNLKEMADSFSRFVPVQFLDFLEKNSVTKIVLGDAVQKQLTVLFSDIREFTHLSEQMNVKDNFRFLNSYLSRMGPLISEHQGFIDKFIGDAIMALFPENPANAIRTAVAMRKELFLYNGHRANKGYKPIEIGIGLNTGDLMLGTVGSKTRLETTVIGDTVNMASRIQSLTKILKTPLIVSERVVREINFSKEFSIREIAKTEVKGKKKPVVIFEVFDGDSSSLIEGKVENQVQFKSGLDLFNEGHFVEARANFAGCEKKCPKDGLNKFYIDQCLHFEALPPQSNFTGINTLL